MKSNKAADVIRMNPVGVYLKGIVAACVFSIFIFILMAILITYTDMSETIIPMLTSIVMVISIAVSGMYTGFRLKRKGWLNGALVGIMYVLFIIVIGWIVFDSFSFGVTALIKLLMGVVSGGIGGMIGVNMK